MKAYKFKTLEGFGHFDHHQSATRICPVCLANVNNIGIDRLAYTMDVCTCREIADYDHVVEQLWHKKCLVEYLTKHPEQQTDYRYMKLKNNKR